jgi:hypothetical protein
MTNLKALDVSGNKIRTHRLLDLLRVDNFVSARKGEFDRNWSGNVLDEEGKEAGLLAQAFECYAGSVNMLVVLRKKVATPMKRWMETGVKKA